MVRYEKQMRLLTDEILQKKGAVGLKTATETIQNETEGKTKRKNEQSISDQKKKIITSIDVQKKHLTKFKNHF